MQVFLNLISNARKYCEADPAVLRISIRHRAGRVTVDFIDNGRGIPKEKQALVFEKFARLTKADQGGRRQFGPCDLPRDHGQSGRHGGYLPGQRSAAFRVTLPLRLGGMRPEAGRVRHLCPGGSETQRVSPPVRDLSARDLSIRDPERPVPAPAGEKRPPMAGQAWRAFEARPGKLQLHCMAKAMAFARLHEGTLHNTLQL